MYLLPLVKYACTSIQSDVQGHAVFRVSWKTFQVGHGRGCMVARAFAERGRKLFRESRGRVFRLEPFGHEPLVYLVYIVPGCKGGHPGVRDLG